MARLIPLYSITVLSLLDCEFSLNSIMFKAQLLAERFDVKAFLPGNELVYAAGRRVASLRALF